MSRRFMLWQRTGSAHLAGETIPMRGKNHRKFCNRLLMSKLDGGAATVLVDEFDTSSFSIKSTQGGC